MTQRGWFIPALAVVSFAGAFGGAAFIAHQQATAPVYECDRECRFVIPDSLPGEVKSDLLQRNMELTHARVQALMGHKVWDESKTAKARGCP